MPAPASAPAPAPASAPDSSCITSWASAAAGGTGLLSTVVPANDSASQPSVRWRPRRLALCHCYAHVPALLPCSPPPLALALSAPSFPTRRRRSPPVWSAMVTAAVDDRGAGRNHKFHLCPNFMMEGACDLLGATTGSAPWFPRCGLARGTPWRQTIVQEAIRLARAAQASWHRHSAVHECCSWCVPPITRCAASMHHACLVHSTPHAAPRHDAHACAPYIQVWCYATGALLRSYH